MSRVKLSQVTEQGVEFANPFDQSQRSLLTPERSMQLQHSIGADIMMCSRLKLAAKSQHY